MQYQQGGPLEQLLVKLVKRDCTTRDAANATAYTKGQGIPRNVADRADGTTKQEC